MSSSLVSKAGFAYTKLPSLVCAVDELLSVVWLELAVGKFVVVEERSGWLMVGIYIGL